MRKRLLPIQLADMTAEQRVVAERIIGGPRGGLRGPFPALLRRPELADAVRQLSDCIRYKNSLQPHLAELAVLVTARHWSAQYEWHAHRTIALKAGLAIDVVNAVEAGRIPDNADMDVKLICLFGRELLSKGEVSDETYDAAVMQFGEGGVVDLIATIGFYTFVALFLNTIQVPVPEGGSVLPPLPQQST